MSSIRRSIKRRMERQPITRINVAGNRRSRRAKDKKNAK